MDVTSVTQLTSANFGLQHTHVWQTLIPSLQRLIPRLQKLHGHEQEAAAAHFSEQLLEQARAFSTGEKAATATGDPSQQLNSLALLALANMYDTVLASTGVRGRRHPVTVYPKVREVLGDHTSESDAYDEAVALPRAMFMMQAASTAGCLTASGHESDVSPAPSPHITRRAALLQQQQQQGTQQQKGHTSPMIKSMGGMSRVSSEIFTFELQ